MQRPIPVHFSLAATWKFDFEIFPDLIGKSKLYTLFLSLNLEKTNHDKFENNQTRNFDSLSNSFDEIHFVDLLILLSDDIYKNENYTSLEKVSSLVK